DDDGYVFDHPRAPGRHGRCSLYPDRTATRKGRSDDLARQAVRARYQALLQEARPLPDVGGRSHQAEVGLPAFHAPGVRRSDEQDGRLLEDDLRWSGWAADRQLETAADFPNARSAWRA